MVHKEGKDLMPAAPYRSKLFTLPFKVLLRRLLQGLAIQAMLQVKVASSDKFNNPVV